MRKDVAKKSFDVGETVSVEFQSACPRNNLRTGDTFLTVERWSEKNGNWEVVGTVLFSLMRNPKCSPRNGLKSALSAAQRGCCPLDGA